MAGTLILFKWSLDEIYTHLTTLSALAAETVSEQTKQDFEKFVISEDEKLFVSSNIESPLLRVASFFRRITPDEVQPIVNDNEVGFSFVPRIAGGKFSYTDESLLRAKSLDMICAQILVRWYALRSIAPLANRLSQEYSHSAVELETALQQFIRPAYVGRATNIVEVDGDIDPKVQDNTTNVTYEQLLTLIGSSALIPNREYRITDYSTSVAEDALLVAVGHRYDIIVHADTPNTLSERARATHSSDDAYFNDAHLSAWDIRYSVQNDTARFPWCNPDGKGVVYYLCDEHGNRAGYDFKNICFDTEMGRLYSISVRDNETGELLDGSLFSATQCSFLGQAPQPNAILLNQGESADRVMLNNCADIYIYGTVKDITATSCNDIIINFPYSENIQIGPYVAYLELYTADLCTADSPARNIFVHSGVGGHSDNYEVVKVPVIAENNHRIEVANNAAGKVRVYVLGSGGGGVIEPGSVTTESFYKDATAPYANRLTKGLTITTKDGTTRYDGEFETNINIPSGEYDEAIEDLRKQVDKKVDTYYQPTDPSNEWSVADYNIHTGDLWHNTTNNHTYRWSGSIWEDYEVPVEVFDAIDGKSAIFASRPNAYHKNDLWILEAEYLLAGDVLHSAGTIVMATVSSSTFDRSHWVKRDRYTDDTDVINAVNNLKVLVEDLQTQVDGSLTSYEGSEVPTLNNYPAVEWDTEEERQRQIGSYYDLATIITNPDGTETITYQRYRFSNPSPGVYEWRLLADGGSAEALSEARKALGLAGTKARLFYGNTQPIPPYNINDIWITVNGVIYVCNADRAEGDITLSEDWMVANDASLRLRQIASDGVVTMEEKSALRNLLAQIRREYSDYVADAEKYGISIKPLANAYQNLLQFLTITMDVEVNVDTNISAEDREQYNNYYADFYAEVTRFTTAISEKQLEDKITEISSDIVVKVDVFYRLSDSATELSGDYEWSTIAPEWKEGTYMWQKTVTYYRTGAEPITAGPTCIAGATGNTGVGIKSVVEEYYLSSSATEMKGGEWLSEPPQWMNGMYYWTRSIITYTDGSVHTTKPICVTAGSVYLIDLSNQMAGVVATAEGAIISEYPTSRAMVYYGSILDEGWAFAGEFIGCKGVINQQTGEIVIDSITASSAKVVVTATKHNAPTLTTTFTLLVIREGEPATIYQLSPSVDKITKTIEGLITPAQVSCDVYKITGNSVRVKTDEKVVKYQNAGVSSSILPYVEPVSVGVNTTSIYFYLYDVDGTTLLDVERIPVLADGQGIEDFNDRLDTVERVIVGIEPRLDVLDGSVADLSNIAEQLGLDLGEIKAQTDKEFTIWFVEEYVDDAEKYEPTPNQDTSERNYPASDWTTEQQIATHEQDIFYNRFSGRAWKFLSGIWEEITDADTIAALTKAQEAYAKAQEALTAANSAMLATDTKRNELAQQLGYVDYEDMVEKAGYGNTIIKGGFLNTALIQTESLIAENVAVIKQDENGNTVEAITILPGEALKVIDYSLSEAGNVKMQIDAENGLRLYQTTAEGDVLTAQYSGEEELSISNIIPTVDAQVILHESLMRYGMIPTTAGQTIELSLCDFTNDSQDTTVIVTLQTLSMIVRFLSRTEATPQGAYNASTKVMINGSTKYLYELSAPVPSAEDWEYRDRFSYRTVVTLQDVNIEVKAGERLEIISTLTCTASLAGCESDFNVRFGETYDVSGSPKFMKLPVRSEGGGSALLMSKYLGNGFVIAKTSNNYIAVLVSEPQVNDPISPKLLQSQTGGLQIQMQCGDIGFKMENERLYARYNDAWVQLDWANLVNMLKQNGLS